MVEFDLSYLVIPHNKIRGCDCKSWMTDSLQSEILPNWSSLRTELWLHFYSEAANQQGSFTSLHFSYSVLAAGSPPIPSMK